MQLTISYKKSVSPTIITSFQADESSLQGDEVRSTAVRRIVSESSTGSTDSKRIRLSLTIRVKKVVYAASGAVEEDITSTEQSSAQAAGNSADGSTLHISGPVSSESQHVKMGAYHTLDLEAGRDFTLIKPPGGWDSIGIERVNEATSIAGGAEVGAIICGEGEYQTRAASHQCMTWTTFQVSQIYA